MVSLAVTGCQKENGGEQPSTDTSSKNESVDNRDSIQPDVMVQIDTINSKILNVSSELYTTKSTISSLESNATQHSWGIIIAGVLGIIGILCGTIAIFGCTKLRDKLAGSEEKIRKLKFKIENFNPDNKSEKSNFSNRTVIELNQRILSLEQELERLKKTYSTTKNQNVRVTSPQSHTPRVKELVKEPAVKGYFGIPSRGGEMGYFKSVSEQKDSDSRFEAEITGNVAKFKPIVNSEAAIKTLFSSDYAKGAYEIIGDPNSGKKNPVVTPGIAIEEGGMWKIKEKAKLDFK